MSIARIHSFQSLGTVDGPGVRCVLFMQGCPLRCVCCHNPDTWDMNGGTEIDIDSAFDKIMRCRGYFGKNGGVTVSGGEPLMQSEFVSELFVRLKAEGIHTCLDTSGCVLDEPAKHLLTVTDLVLLDIKYTTDEEYKKYTGIHSDAPTRFLNYANLHDIPTWIRQVIIPGLNDTDKSVLQLREFCEEYTCIQKIELLPFRKLCIEKYKTMGVCFPLEDTPETSEQTMQRLEKLLNCKAVNNA